MTKINPIQSVFAAAAHALDVSWNPVAAFHEPYPQDECVLLRPTEKAYFQLHAKSSPLRLPMRGAVFPSPPHRTTAYQWWILMERDPDWFWLGYANTPAELIALVGTRRGQPDFFFQRGRS